VNQRKSVLTLNRASAEQLQYIYDTERLPGYQELVARWSLEAHHLALARPDTEYLIGSNSAGHPVGFVILQPISDLHEGTKIKRVAVSDPGKGHGRALLCEAFNWVFSHSESHRIWLDVFAHNTRAIAAYRAVGMTMDGVLRSAYELRPGQYVDRYILSLLRGEWQGLTP
jgi:RimJ/RimL family protein N-acetyltransferase